MNIEPADNGKAHLKVFATNRQTVNITASCDNGCTLLDKTVTINPEKIFEQEIDTQGTPFESVSVKFVKDGRTIMEWRTEPDEIRPIPDAAEAALLPHQIKTVEQLFLTGLHLEQYRHATYSPVDYYEEGLRRDPDDVRCNNALGLWYIRKGRFDIAEKYLEKAVKVLQKRNPNPYDGEPIYNLGLALRYQGRHEEAYNRFYKSTWNGAWQDAGYFACAQISCMLGNYTEALYEADRSLLRNWHNPKARTIKAAILKRMGRHEEANELCVESLKLDKFNYGCLFISGNTHTLVELMHGSAHNYDETALEFVRQDYGARQKPYGTLPSSQGQQHR